VPHEGAIRGQDVTDTEEINGSLRTAHGKWAAKANRGPPSGGSVSDSRSPRRRSPLEVGRSAPHTNVPEGGRMTTAPPPSSSRRR
jgi:ArsR family metal-binding transcriptional regulator